MTGIPPPVLRRVCPVVWLALDRLARAHLLAERVERAQPERFSRRDLARKLGIATVVVPMVMTILAPTPSGTYTITVTAKVGSITRNALATLTVQ